MVLHIGIVNEMVIHSDVLPISRWAKISSARRRQTIEVLSKTPRPQEMKEGSFV